MGADVAVAATIGFVVGAVALYLLDRRMILGRSGRLYHFGWNGPRFARLGRSKQQPSPDELEHWRRSVSLFGAIPGSPLRRVIGVGASASTDDLTVELIAIELRDAGGRGLLRFRSQIGRMGGSQYAMVGEPEVDVTDDVGTYYEVGLGGWSGSQDGGDAEFTFAPRPPDDARRLSIVVERFRESRLPPGHELSGPPDGIVGPWKFTVEIAEG
ncbi:MAG: hypothetical protein Q8M74_02560 [Chloroflexota bacterium]|nr:hypothetical protein [Chloroflexota bacterium]